MYDIRPKFSIVIPTRNRVETLQHTMDTCLCQMRFDDYEIIVNDNSDGEEARLYIENKLKTDLLAKQKVRYHKRSVICSMSENFDDAISRAKGEFVIVIGDDDGILPMALFEINTLINETGAAIIKWKNGLYNWPDMELENASNYLGFCVMRSIDIANGKTELLRSLQTFSYENLPMLYINSAIRRDVIGGIRDREGKLFRSRSPDVYSAVVLAHACGEFINVSVPFTVAGLSRSSNGVSSAFAGKNSAPRMDFNELNDQSGLFRHPHVPNLIMFPVIEFAEAFNFAKGFHFSADDDISMSRKDLIQACVDRADTGIGVVRQEILRVCEDDAELIDYAKNLMLTKNAYVPARSLKPANLGSDGENLHLDGRDFGIENIKDAIMLVHKIIWPLNAKLRYDLKRPPN